MLGGGRRGCLALFTGHCSPAAAVAPHVASHHHQCEGGLLEYLNSVQSIVVFEKQCKIQSVISIITATATADNNDDKGGN